MTSYGVVLLCFLASFLVHILIYKRVPVIVAYMAGALLLYRLGATGNSSLPWSSAVLFALLSAAAILFYLTPSMGTKIPTSVIVRSFRKKRVQRLSDLTALFTDRELIGERIDFLIQRNLVVRSGTSLRLTHWGKIVWNIMKAYKHVFFRTQTE